MYSSISVAPSTSLKFSPSLATNRRSWPPHRLTITQCSLPLTATTTTKTAFFLPNSASNQSLASLTNQPRCPSLTIELPEADGGGGSWKGGGRGSTGGGGDDKDHVFDDDDELFGWFGLPRFYAGRLWRRLKWNLLAKMSADPGLPRKLLWEALSSAAWSLFFDIVRNFFNDESSERPAILLLANAGAEALCGVYIMLNFAPSICYLASASIGRKR